MSPPIWPRPSPSGSGWKDGPAAAARGPLAVVALATGVALLLAGCVGAGKPAVEGAPPAAVDVAGLCAKAASVVATYDAVNAATERRIGPEERAAAAVARVILATQCGGAGG